ncbi:MAG: N-acetylneuraminate synthase [bacterium]
MRKEQINIAGRTIGDNQPVFIISEAGVNHNGDVKIAKKMIEAAKDIGADAIKFQTFKADELVIPNAPKAEYQNKTTSGKSQYEMLKELELSENEFKKLFNYCQKKNIIFLSTPFDFQSAEFLYKLGVPAFKIGSGDLTNIPLLIQVAKYGKPIILSTGMSTLAEVKEAVKPIYSTGNKKLILLHCTSNYPTKYEDVNLKAMVTLKDEFNLPIGYSDHTEGIEVSVGAVALGACVIEKHFTLDKNLAGPDHKASLEPDEFRKMVQSIRNVEMAMGNGIKKPTKSEIEVQKVARKSIVVARDIPKGTRLSLDMLAIKRPGTGIEPKYLDKLVDKQVITSIKKDQILTWSMMRI